jgi:Fur family ferric uptake transcriptional regulator
VDGKQNVMTIIARCEAKGLRMTGQRRVIARALQDSADHPDVEELYARASALDAGISLATVYRTVKLFEEAGILDRLEFGDGRARYEDADRDHHDHLIDINTGEVIEFCDPDIEALQERIAAKLGFQLKGHKLELYGVPLNKKAPVDNAPVDKGPIDTGPIDTGPVDRVHVAKDPVEKG